MPINASRGFLPPGKKELAFYSWVYFGLFLVSNSILSFFTLPLPALLWTSLLGLALPFSIGAWNAVELRMKSREKAVFSGEIFTPPPWLWIPFILLLLLTRFYHLTTLPFWPLPDEGLENFLGMGQSLHWQWRMLWAEAQIEPFFTWFLGIYFKILQPSLFSIRFLPAMVSLFTFLAAYWAAGQWGKKSFAFLFSGLVAFSFWEFMLVRTCMHVIFLPLLQCLCLGWFGRFWKSADSRSKWLNLLALAFFISVGMYIWTNWTVVAASFFVLILIGSFSKGRGEWGFPVVYGALVFLSYMPLVEARLAPGGMTHIRQIFNLHDFQPLCGYLLEIFWNGKNCFPFGSNWGGLLNPLMDSWFLMGILFLIKNGPRTVIMGLAACLALSFLPGALASGIEPHRLIPFQLFLMVPITLGFAGLLESVPKGLGRLALFGFMLLASFTLDAYNYVFHYDNPKEVPSEKQWRNIQYYDAFQILQNLAARQGPLYVFSEFNTDYDNKILDIADYPFNAAENPSLSDSSPAWACVITNLQYAPYFLHTFPGLQFNVLKTDKTGPEDPKPFGIFLIPTSQIPVSMLAGWRKADEFYRRIDFDVKNRKTYELWAGFLEKFPVPRDLFQADRFLISVYWEKMGFFKFLDGYFIQATEAYRNAVRWGVPAAHLYYDLGVCLKIQNRTSESNQCFRKARLLSEWK